MVAPTELRGSHGGEVVEGPNQEVEPLVDLEPGLLERQLVGRAERSGDGAGVPRRRELVDRTVHGGDGGPAAAGCDVGDGGVTSPGRHPKTRVGAREEAVPCHRRNGTGAS